MTTAPPTALPTAPATAPATAPSTTHDRVVETAVRLTVDIGWSHVTMARVADDVGVSRQTVYNEIGSKPRLAELMIQRELERFLALVTRAFDERPDDLVAAIRDACLAVLESAHDNPLLRAVASATHGADTELLPLLTTHAGSLLSTAKAIVTERTSAYDVDVEPSRLDAAIDVVVRVVLSHVMQPSGPPAATADDIAWFTGRVLCPG